MTQQITPSMDPWVIEDAVVAADLAGMHATVLRQFNVSHHASYAGLLMDVQYRREEHREETGWSAELHPGKVIFRHMDPATREAGGQVVTITTKRPGS